MRSQLFDGRVLHDHTCQSVFTVPEQHFLLNSRQVKRSVKEKIFKPGLSLKECKDMEKSKEIGLYYAHLP